MELSTHNQNSSSNNGSLKPPLKRIARKLPPPQSTGLDALAQSEFTTGDTVDEHANLSTHAHAVSQLPDGFHPPMCQWLAAEGLEYNRARRYRAAARNHQIEEEREILDNTYADVDDNFRQYHAEAAIVASPSQRAIRRNGDASFRHAMRVHDTLIKTRILAKK